MSMRRSPLQFDLLDLVPTRQIRRRERESAVLYGTVMALRARGIPVRPEGRRHRVNGALMTTAEMYVFARKIGASRAAGEARR